MHFWECTHTEVPFECWDCTLNNYPIWINTDSELHIYWKYCKLKSKVCTSSMKTLFCKLTMFSLRAAPDIVLPTQMFSLKLTPRHFLDGASDLPLIYSALWDIYQILSEFLPGNLDTFALPFKWPTFQNFNIVLIINGEWIDLQLYTTLYWFPQVEFP